MASNGVPMVFAKQIAWVYFGPQDSNLGTNAIRDVIDLEGRREDTSMCIE